MSVQTTDEETGGSSTEDDYDTVTKPRHILEGNGGGGLATAAWNKYIKRLVRKELESSGICVQSRNERQGRKPSKHICGRSGRSHRRSGGDILSDYANQTCLNNSILSKNPVQIMLNDCETEISIPLFLKASCDFIRQHIDNEGIFRKPGASSRKQRIVESLLRLSTKDELINLFAPGDTVYDACSALTHILRNLQNPLIPYDLHAIFLSCLELEPRKLCVSSLLEAICLLPSSSISVLSFFVQFLQEVSQHSSKNLMVTNNLSVVMVENIMPAMPKEDRADGSRTPNTPLTNPKEMIDRHSQVIETLIEYGDKVGYLTSRLQERIRENPMRLSDAGSSDEDDEGENSPRKKRRSSSLNRLFGNIFRKNTKVPKSIDAANLSCAKTPLSLTGHTPIIKDGSKKFNSKTDRLNSVYNSHKANQELLTKIGGLRNLNVTPYNACRTTPAISLNPSPKSAAHAETPFGPKRKYFASSNLLKKRLKTSPPDTKPNVPPSECKQSFDTPKPSVIHLVQFEASPRKLQLQEAGSAVSRSNSSRSTGSTGLAKSARPRPNSFHSPRTTPSSGNTITRSPSMRRTLRRGRPNTLRVGLTRPSPTSNVVKIEPSPPVLAVSGSGRLLRSTSNSGHTIKKESFMFGSGDTSPRKKVTIEPSGRVISRNSNGRPALDIPKTPVQEVQDLETTYTIAKTEEDTSVSPVHEKSNREKPTALEGEGETRTRTPLLRVNTSISVTDGRSPRKAAPASRSQSLRDSTRSYIPRPIANNNLNKKPSFRECIEEEMPTTPKKSVSTSAMTPIQEKLRRRNSVQELVKMYESNANISKIPITQEYGRPKPSKPCPYPFAAKTLDRGKLEPYYKYNSMTRPTK